MKALLAQQSMPDRRNEISFDTALDKSYAGIGDNVGSASGIFDDAKGKQKGSAGVRDASNDLAVEEPDTKIFAAMFGAGEDDDEEAQRPVEDESTLGVNSRQQKAADTHTHTHTHTHAGGEGGGTGGGGRVSLPHSRLFDKVLITSTQIRALIGPQ
jgi:hypothetical protein